MKVTKKIFIIALILSLILSVSAIAAAENITFDQSDISKDSIESTDNLGASQDNFENTQSVSQEIDGQNDKLTAESQEVLCENHTVEGNTFQNITDKINSAKEGDTIFLGGKNYTGNSIILISKSNLTIIGGSSLDDEAVATIDFAQSASMRITASNIVIKGVKFINSRTHDGTINWKGDNGTISDCVFANNNASNNGGAIYWRGANASISNCAFYNNTAGSNGGAIFMFVVNSTISECEFYNNSATSNGGAINYWYGVNATVINNEFKNNSAGYQGGAINAIASLTIDSCSFTSNKAVKSVAGVNLQARSIVSNCNFMNNSVSGQDIGGLAINRNANCSVVENCTFINNRANRYVGAVKVFANEVLIKNITFINNTAELSSGALSIDHGAVNCTVDSCKFINNTAKYRGGALNWNGPEGKIINSQFENNTGVNGGALYVDGDGAQVEGCNFTGNTASNGGAIYFDSDNGTIDDCGFSSNTADYGGAIHTIGDNITVANSNFTNNSANAHGSSIWVDGPDNILKSNDIDNSHSNKSAIHVTNNHNLTMEGNDIKGINITYTEIVIEVNEKFIGHIGETLEIPVYIHDTIGDPLIGEVNMTDMESQYLSNGRVTFHLDITSEHTEAFMLVLTFEHLTREIWVHPANPEKAIENITQSDDDSLEIKFPEDATGNVTVIIAGKNYTATVANGSALIKINESLNGTYNAEVIYTGDEIYKNMTTSLNVTVKNSNVTVVIEAGDKIAFVNESIPIPVVVKTSLGDMLPGEVSLLLENGTVLSTLALDNGETTFEVKVPNAVVKFNLIVKYGDYSKSIKIEVVDPKNPIEGISQAENGNVVVSLPSDAKGNVTLTVGSKNYTVPVVNGTAVVNVTDLPNGTYPATLTYSGDGKYDSMTSNMDVTVKNSNVTVVIEASDKVAFINETIQIPVIVKTSLGDLLSGEVTVLYDGLEMDSRKLENGQATFSLQVPDIPYKFEMTFKYGNYTKTIQIEVVDPKKPIGGITQPENGTDSVIVNLPSDAKGNVTVTVGGKNYTVPVVNGTAVIDINDLPNGEYPATVTYSGDGKYDGMTQDIKITVKNSKVNPVYRITGGKDIKVIYSGKATYKVLVTKDGKAVVGEYVTISYNGKNVKVKTDAKGYASLKLNTKVKVKTYTIKTTYNGASATNKVKIAQLIKASNKKVKKSKKVTKIKIKLKKVNGKYIKKKTLKIKFNKKTYKVKTNKKGVATWKVKKSMLKKLKVGKKVKYTVTYGKATLTKKLTIKK